MMPVIRTASLGFALSFLFLDAGVPPAHATTVDCQRAIVRAGSQFVQAKVKALTACRQAVVKGKSTDPCPDARAETRIDAANAKLVATIDESCGGADRHCGGVNDGDDRPSLLGWPLTCPSFEHGACTNSIVHCGDIATCIACIGGATVDQAMRLYYDDLVLPSSGDRALNRCQRAIGQASAAYVTARAKAVEKCWDRRFAGKHGGSCVPPATGDGKYLGKMAKTEAKMRSTICKACGGADRRCDDVDDLTPAEIGFPSACPAVTVPGGAACGNPITDLESLVDCVDCASTFKSECGARSAVPQFTAYPDACNVCVAPTPSGPCPTSLAFTAAGPAVELDTGWTGLAHGSSVPTNGRLTVTLSGCAGSSQPTCGQCGLDGPIDNDGGAAFQTHRCLGSPWVACAVDADCTNAGAVGPCRFFFGAPLPLVAGGVSTCVVNSIAGAVTGTANLSDGTTSAVVPLLSQVYQTADLLHPCPRCVSGTCKDGIRIQQPCTVQGSGAFGDVSLDCPPSGTVAGVLNVTLQIATDTPPRTVTAASPNCTANAFQSTKCFCDTCNNAARTPCASDADCPISGGSPGVCGGKRCSGGSNNGGPCNVDSACPGAGHCGRPGEPTKPNACADDSTTPEDGLICQDLGDDRGECLEGPVDQYCSIDTRLGCSQHADCNPPVCADCATGQTCQPRQRTCFLDTVAVATAADPPCGSLASPTLGSFFCVPPTGSTAIDSAAGLPGLGRIRLPGNVTVGP